MKQLFTLSFLLFSIFLFPQVPQSMSYQAVAVDSNGSPLINDDIGVRISILDNSANGTVVYEEIHTKNTNLQGVFNLKIGQGTPTHGAFSSIDWGVNPKFLQLEIDITGGDNYALVGATQLLSTPYALAADSLVTSPGEGITLVSPNGTPYQLTVDDNGFLSLPTSNQQANTPSQLFMYGSFNDYDASSALQFGNYFQDFIGYKYLTAGTEIKFLAAQNENVVYGGSGNNSDGNLVLNGLPITIQANGFYRILVQNNGIEFFYDIDSINVELETNFSSFQTMFFDINTETFFLYSDTFGQIRFMVDRNFLGIRYGDNLADGIVEIDGAFIDIPFISGQPSRLYQFNLNFNGTGNYSVTF